MDTPQRIFTVLARTALTLIAFTMSKGYAELADVAAELSSTLPPVESSNPSIQECTSAYHNMNVGLRHQEARGVGYKKGYTTLEFFGASDYFGNYFLPFLDLRGHVFNDGRLAGNVGIGARSLISSINHFIGGYVYYDVRNAHRLTVNQIGPGFEVLGNRMEYRINGYFPVSTTKSHVYGTAFDKFKGNRLYIKSKRKRALTGGDAEVGVHMTQSSKFDLFGGIGPYYLSANDSHAWGGKARLKGSYKEYVSLEVTSTYDRLFKGTVEGSISVNIPFGKKLKRSEKTCFKAPDDDLLLTRAVESPYRFEIPMIKTHTKKSVAINPVTGLPYQFWFVNNTSSSLGTFESPFPTLLQAQVASGPNDVIYVFPGDGTAKGMNQGITLATGQKYFGSGISIPLATTLGTITIPALTLTRPLISAVIFANVITLVGADNEVAGFNMTATQGGASAIFGTSLSGVYIHDNFITCTVADFGIDLSGAGTLIVQNNVLINTGLSPFTGISFGVNRNNTHIIATNNITSGFMTAAIDVVNSAGNTTVNIANNLVGRAGSTITRCIRLQTTGPSATISGTLFNNMLTQAVNGILLDASSSGLIDVDIVANALTNMGPAGNGIFSTFTTGPAGTVKSRITKNIITTVTGQGINIQANGNNCHIIDSNIINGSTLNGLLIQSNAGQNNVFVTNNTFENIPGGSFAVNAQTADTSTLCLRLTNNTALVNVPNGYTVVNTPPATINLEPLTGNQGTFGPITNVTNVPANTCACSP